MSVLNSVRSSNRCHAGAKLKRKVFLLFAVCVCLHNCLPTRALETGSGLGDLTLQAPPRKRKLGSVGRKLKLSDVVDASEKNPPPQVDLSDTSELEAGHVVKERSAGEDVLSVKKVPAEKGGWWKSSFLNKETVDVELPDGRKFSVFAQPKDFPESVQSRLSALTGLQLDEDYVLHRVFSLDKALGPVLQKGVSLKQQAIDEQSTLRILPLKRLTVRVPPNGVVGIVIEYGTSVQTAIERLLQTTNRAANPKHYELIFGGKTLNPSTTFGGNGGVPLDAKVQLLKRPGLTVLLSGGRSVALDLSPKDSVKAVRDQIASVLGPSHEGSETRLAFNGKELQDPAAPLEAAGVTFGDELKLIQTPPFYVKLPSGKTVPVDVGLGSKGADLADRIRQVTWLPVREQFSLEFGDDHRLVDLDQPLEAQGAAPGTQFHLVSLPQLFFEDPTTHTKHPLPNDLVRPSDPVSKLVDAIREHLGASSLPKDSDVCYLKRNLNPEHTLSSQRVPFGAVLSSCKKPNAPDVSFQVVLPDKTSVPSKLPLDASVGELKEKLATPGLPAHAMAITLDKKPLPDRTTLRQAGVKEGSVLNAESVPALTVSLPSGVKHPLYLSLESTTIKDLKNYLNDQLKVPTATAVMTIAGSPIGGSQRTPLAENTSLANAGVPFGAQVDVSTRPAFVARFPDGSTAPVAGDPSESVHSLKQRLAPPSRSLSSTSAAGQEGGGFRPDDYTLVVNGSPIVDESKSLLDHKVRPGTQVDVVPRPGVFVSIPQDLKEAFGGRNLFPIHLPLSSSPDRVLAALESTVGSFRSQEPFALAHANNRLIPSTSLASQGVPVGAHLHLTHTPTVLNLPVPSADLHADDFATAPVGSAVASVFNDPNAGGRRRDRRSAMARLLAAKCPPGYTDLSQCEGLDSAAALVLDTHQHRRHMVIFVFILLLIVLAILYQLLLRALSYKAERSSNRLLKDVLQTIFRQLAVIMLVLATILIGLQVDFIEYDLDQLLFGDVLRTLPVISEFVTESHLEMIFDDMLLFTMIFTAVYIAFTFTYVTILWWLMSWLRKADEADPNLLNRDPKSEKWWTSQGAILRYWCFRSEFEDSVESSGIPGLDPSGYYFKEYLQACLIRTTIDFLRLPNTTLCFCLLMSGLMFPLLNGKHVQPMTFSLLFSGIPFVVLAGLLSRIVWVRHQLEPRDMKSFVNMKATGESSALFDPQAIAEFGPPYKHRPKGKRMFCWPWWTRWTCGTLSPTKHESLFVFWANSPALLKRLIEGCYFFLTAVVAAMFFLSEHNQHTFQNSWGQGAALCIWIMVILQICILPTIMYNLLIISFSSGIIDSAVLQDVWEAQRAETVKRSARFVDMLRIDACLFEIEFGGAPFWRRLVVASETSTTEEVEIQNRTIFVGLDDDNDGLIEARAFYKWLYSQGLSISSEKEAYRWFQLFDRDNKGGLDAKEFRMVVVLVKRLLTDPLDVESVRSLLLNKYGLSSDVNYAVDYVALQSVICKQLNLKWTAGQARHFLDFLAGQRVKSMPVTKFILRIQILESETLGTLQQAVGKLRDRPAPDQYGLSASSSLLQGFDP